jgi:hypothetical protein
MRKQLTTESSERTTVFLCVYCGVSISVCIVTQRWRGECLGSCLIFDLSYKYVITFSFRIHSYTHCINALIEYIQLSKKIFFFKLVPKWSLNGLWMHEQTILSNICFAFNPFSTDQPRQIVRLYSAWGEFISHNIRGGVDRGSGCRQCREGAEDKDQRRWVWLV